LSIWLLLVGVVVVDERAALAVLVVLGLELLLQ
jgi:hypothetical protein